MSEFYSVYFVRDSGQELPLTSVFSQVSKPEDSEWWVCNFSDDYEDGMYEPDHYFTLSKSEKLGDVCYFSLESRNDQFEYEHSRDGQLLRKLTWCSDGSESTWLCVEGDPEPWESEVIFSERNFAKTLDFVGYSLSEDERAEKENELRALWAAQEYLLDSPCPMGDAYFAEVIQNYWGMKKPAGQA